MENNGTFTEQTFEYVSLKADTLQTLREQKKAYEEQAGEIEKKIQEVKRELISILSAADVERFDSKLCTVFVREKSSVKTPKAEEEKELLYSYLREQGILDSMLSINSRTLNAWAKAELDRRLAEGFADPKIPGIEEITYYTDLEVREKKGKGED